MITHPSTNRGRLAVTWNAQLQMPLLYTTTNSHARQTIRYERAIVRGLRGTCVGGFGCECVCVCVRASCTSASRYRVTHKTQLFIRARPWHRLRNPSASPSRIKLSDDCSDWQLLRKLRAGPHTMPCAFPRSTELFAFIVRPAIILQRMAARSAASCHCFTAIEHNATCEADDIKLRRRREDGSS